MHGHLDKRSSELIAQTNRIGVDFLFTELKAGLTFLQLALATTPSDERSRQFDKAFKVYCTVIRLLPKVILTSQEASEIQVKLGDLRRQLEDAGYSCDT